jgi:hypothetical protein
MNCRSQTNLIVLQVHARIFGADVLAGAGWHVASFENVVVQRIASVLPLGRLGPTDTLGNPVHVELEIRHWMNAKRDRGLQLLCLLATLIGVIVGVLQFMEGLGGDLAEPVIHTSIGRKDLT